MDTILITKNIRDLILKNTSLGKMCFLFRYDKSLSLYNLSLKKLYPLSILKKLIENWVNENLKYPIMINYSYDLKLTSQIKETILSVKTEVKFKKDKLIKLNKIRIYKRSLIYAKLLKKYFISFDTLDIMEILKIDKQVYKKLIKD